MSRDTALTNQQSMLVKTCSGELNTVPRSCCRNCGRSVSGRKLWGSAHLCAGLSF